MIVENRNHLIQPDDVVLHVGDLAFWAIILVLGGMTHAV
jgi:calcineurin-like phosphoesterase family protein